MKIKASQEKRLDVRIGTSYVHWGHVVHTCELNQHDPDWSQSCELWLGVLHDLVNFGTLDLGSIWFVLIQVTYKQEGVFETLFLCLDGQYLNIYGHIQCLIGVLGNFSVLNYIYFIIGLHERSNACDILHIDLSLKISWSFII